LSKLWNEDRIISTIFKEIRDEGLEKLRFMDIGCGGGREIVRIAWTDKDALCFGLDLSSEMIQRTLGLKKKIKLANLALIRGSALNLPFNDSIFNCVLCSFLLMLFGDIELRAAIAEIHRILCKNGILFAIVFSPNDPSCLNRNWTDQETASVSKLPIGFFTESQIRKLFEDFQVKSLLSFDYLDSSHGYPHTHNVWFLIALKPG